MQPVWRARGCARTFAAARGGGGQNIELVVGIRLLSRIGKAGSIAAASRSLD
jgi:hypothetical protein